MQNVFQFPTHSLEFYISLLPFVVINELLLNKRTCLNFAIVHFSFLRAANVDFMTGFKIDNYIIKHRIGTGATAEVRIAEHHETGEVFAVKIFNLDSSDEDRMKIEATIRTEIQVMQYLRHPNIVHIQNVLLSKTKLYLFMEYVDGGELYDEIVNHRRIGESTSRHYFQQIVDAVVYCHRRGVVHRDLKPENLLIDRNSGNIKITDFGLSRMREAIDGKKQMLKTQCGTPKYMAPEVIARAPNGYDGEKCDAWECGVVLYALIAGYLPFTGESEKDVFRSVIHTKLRFPKFFSLGLRDILSKLLQKDPQKRATLEEIRSHPWFLVDYQGEGVTLRCKLLKGARPESLREALERHRLLEQRARTLASPLGSMSQHLWTLDSSSSTVQNIPSSVRSPSDKSKEIHIGDSDPSNKYLDVIERDGGNYAENSIGEASTKTNRESKRISMVTDTILQPRESAGEFTMKATLQQRKSRRNTRQRSKSRSRICTQGNVPTQLQLRTPRRDQSRTQTRQRSRSRSKTRSQSQVRLKAAGRWSSRGLRERLEDCSLTLTNEQNSPNADIHVALPSKSGNIMIPRIPDDFPTDDNKVNLVRHVSRDEFVSEDVGIIQVESEDSYADRACPTSRNSSGSDKTSSMVRTEVLSPASVPQASLAFGPLMGRRFQRKHDANEGTDRKCGRKISAIQNPQSPVGANPPSPRYAMPIPSPRRILSPNGILRYSARVACVGENSNNSKCENRDRISTDHEPGQSVCFKTQRQEQELKRDHGQEPGPGQQREPEHEQQREPERERQREPEHKQQRELGCEQRQELEREQQTKHKREQHCEPESEQQQESGRDQQPEPGCELRQEPKPEQRQEPRDEWQTEPGRGRRQEEPDHEQQQNPGHERRQERGHGQIAGQMQVQVQDHDQLNEHEQGHGRFSLVSMATRLATAMTTTGNGNPEGGRGGRNADGNAASARVSANAGRFSLAVGWRMRHGAGNSGGRNVRSDSDANGNDAKGQSPHGDWRNLPSSAFHRVGLWFRK